MIKITKSKFFILTMVLSISLSKLFNLNAQVLNWQPVNGPYGTSSNVIGFFPTINNINNQLFVGSDYGVYTSSDTGITWNCISNNLPDDVSISSIIYYANQYFVASNRGVYSSGSNFVWNKLNTGLIDTVVNDLKVFNNNLYAATNNGVFKYLNNLNWAFASIGIPSCKISKLDTNNTMMFAATDLGLFSSNNGVNWSILANGLPSIAIDNIATNGNIIFAGTNIGLYKSTSNGSSWLKIGLNLPGSVKGINSLDFQNNILFVGKFINSIYDTGALYKSVDNGLTWISSSSGIRTTFPFLKPAYYNITFKDNVLFLISSLGVHISNNNGLTWESRGLGHANNTTEIKRLINKLFCTTKNGIYKSIDNGNSWQLKKNGLPSNTCVNSITSLNNLLFIGTWADGIFKSVDSGENWTQVNSGISNKNISCIRSFSNTLIASTQLGSDKIYISTNYGNSWVASNNGIPSNVNIYKIEINNFQIIASTSLGIYISTNYGNSWVASNNGIPSTDVFTSKTINNEIFIGLNYPGSGPSMSKGVYSSNNYCSSWNLKNLPVDLLSVSTIEGNSSIILAGTTNNSQNFNNLFVSYNSGLTWIYTGSDILSNNISDILNFNNEILLATNSPSWPYNSNVLYRGTSLWKCNLTNSLIDFKDINISVFPNPTTGKITIEYPLKDIKVVFFNIYGQQILESNSKIVDISSFSDGIYIMKIYDSNIQLIGCEKITKQ